MADSDALRMRRRRMHQRGDHSLCRPDRCGDAAKIVTIKGGGAAQPDTPTSTALVDAYRARLEEAGRLQTPEGQHVIRLAEVLSRMTDSASGMASLSRELRAAMQTALEGVKPAADAMDELAQRRRQKLAGGA